MHCNKTTRDKLAEIQDKGVGLTPLELRQVGDLAGQVAEGVEVYSAVISRVVASIHSLRVEESALPNTAEQSMSLYDCGGRRVHQQTVIEEYVPVLVDDDDV